MKLDVELARRSTGAARLLPAPVALGALVIAAALHSIACEAEVQDQSTTAASSSSGSAGAGGMAGAGGSGGTAGNGGMGGNGGAVVPDDGGSGDVAYSAYNLFTHVPRFIIFKTDPVQNLCFRIWVEGFSGGGPLMIDVTAPWAASHAEVTNDISDCVMSSGFPPQPMTSAPASSGNGTIVVEGTFPCSVSVHANITFDTSEPMTEAFDVDALPVDGGCG
ncbi:MAG: hypothetical protein IPM54_02185 [Polyangiaceae bacterium]|nr:hypothetical protein [Polyangiaceae bacterium]